MVIVAESTRERKRICCGALDVAIGNLRINKKEEEAKVERVANHLSAESFATLQIEYFQQNISSNSISIAEESIRRRKQKILSGDDNCICSHCGEEIDLEYLKIRPLTPICQNCEKAAGVEGIGLRITTPKVPRKR